MYRPRPHRAPPLIPSRRVLVCWLLLLIGGSSAQAQIAVTFTTNTTTAAGNTQFDGDNISAKLNSTVMTAKLTITP